MHEGTLRTLERQRRATNKEVDKVDQTSELSDEEYI